MYWYASFLYHSSVDRPCSLTRQLSHAICPVLQLPKHLASMWDQRIGWLIPYLPFARFVFIYLKPLYTNNTGNYHSKCSHGFHIFNCILFCIAIESNFKTKCHATGCFCMDHNHNTVCNLISNWHEYWFIKIYLIVVFENFYLIDILEWNTTIIVDWIHIY